MHRFCSITVNNCSCGFGFLKNLAKPQPSLIPGSQPSTNHGTGCFISSYDATTDLDCPQQILKNDPIQKTEKWKTRGEETNAKVRESTEAYCIHLTKKICCVFLNLNLYRYKWQVWWQSVWTLWTMCKCYYYQPLWIWIHSYCLNQAWLGARDPWSAQEASHQADPGSVVAGWLLPMYTTGHAVETVRKRSVNEQHEKWHWIWFKNNSKYELFGSFNVFTELVWDCKWSS